jgi:hypothetical protein
MEPTTVLRSGKIFHCGDFPSKKFSLSPAELAAAAAEFQPVPVDLSHVSTVLDGQLGELREVKVGADGETLFGTVALPEWLDQLLTDGKRKVSCTWDRQSKRLTKLALTPTPHLQDAVLMDGADTAAEVETAQFAADFTEPAAGSGGSSDATAAESGKKGQPMNPLQRFLALFATKAGVDPEDADLKALAAEFSADEKTEKQQPDLTAQEQRIQQLEAQNAATLAQFAAERRVRLEGEADAFARDIITVQKRALPAEFSALRQQYLQAAEDDAKHGGEVTFGADQKGRRVDALRAAQALRPAHSLTDETMQSGLMALFNRADGDKKQDEPSLDPADIYARRQKAMNGKGA